MSTAEVETEYDECGTYAGWNKHRRDRTRTCEPCKTASREYMQEYRKRNPDKVAAGRAQTNAQSRALWRLAHLHPTEFGLLLAEEKAPQTALPRAGGHVGGP